MGEKETWAEAKKKDDRGDRDERLAGEADEETARATTVKSAKSNSSERLAGGGGAGGDAAQATTVKGSKSNTSERSAGDPGVEAEARAVNLNSSKSNRSRSGGSAGDDIAIGEEGVQRYGGMQFSGGGQMAARPAAEPPAER